MEHVLEYSSITNGKIITLDKSDKVFEIVQVFLKALGIKRDYRKDFLKGELWDDRWDSTTTKNGRILITAFVTKNKTYLQAICLNEEYEDLLFKSIGNSFSR